MKFAILVLLLVPVAHGVFLNSFSGLFNLSELKSVVTEIFDVLGSDATEAGCELVCTQKTKDMAIVSSACDLICKSFQSLVHHFGLHKQ